MFTGIIQAVGKIHEYDARGNDARMVIAADGRDSQLREAAGIAVESAELSLIPKTTVEVAEEVSGRDLSAFFAQWLHGTAAYLAMVHPEQGKKWLAEVKAILKKEGA